MPIVAEGKQGFGTGVVMAKAAPARHNRAR
jgi:hypothetical protein